MITLLVILSNATVIHSESMLTYDNTCGYDIRRDGDKFRRKYNKPNIDIILSRIGEKRCSKPINQLNQDSLQQFSREYESLKISAKSYLREKNAILDAIEKHGLEAINNRADLNPLIPLFVAIHNDDPNLVEFLLQHGADINKASISPGFTIYGGVPDGIFYPIQNFRSLKMLQYLEENGADLSPLFNNPSPYSLPLDSTPELSKYIEKKKAEYNQLQEQLAKTQQ